MKLLLDLTPLPHKRECPGIQSLIKKELTDTGARLYGVTSV